MLIVVLVNTCCSRWINSLILLPMKEIRQGMKKVKSGVLDGEIPVLRQDEQGEVCEELIPRKRAEPQLIQTVWGVGYRFKL